MRHSLFHARVLLRPSALFADAAASTGGCFALAEVDEVVQVHCAFWI